MAHRAAPETTVRTARHGRVTTAVLAVVLGVLSMLLAVPGAAAKGGTVGGSGATYYLSSSFSAEADTVFVYGRADDEVYVGDWDGDGRDTLAVRRGATFYVSDSNSSGPADDVVTYGRPGDVVLVGDWDGDGRDTLAVRRGSVYHVKNSMSGGPADQVVAYGRPGDAVLVGDWDADGRDTLAVRRGAAYYLKNSISGGEADITLAYGRAGDAVYVGDFDGNGADSLTVRRGNVYYISNTFRGGEADRVVPYGRATDTALVGDWDGDGTDSLGVRRPPAAPVAGAQDAYDARMVELINEARAANGVAPLTSWAPLRRGALTHSTWMVTNGFEHASGTTMLADAAAAGCPSGVAENIFWSSYVSTPEQAMDAYINSPGHRANILDPDLKFAATGTILVDGEIFNTQRFSSECS